MIFPINVNKIEQLELDPEKKVNGYIWFNKSEKVYKTWLDETLHVFLTDKSDLITNLGVNIEKKFTFTFSDADSINIKHNNSSKFFNYNIFDTNLNENIAASVSIIDENEIQIEFVDPVTGYIVMYFQ